MQWFPHSAFLASICQSDCGSAPMPACGDLRGSEGGVFIAEGQDQEYNGGKVDVWMVYGTRIDGQL